MIIKLVLGLAFVKLYYSICILYRLTYSHLPIDDCLTKIETLAIVSFTLLFLTTMEDGGEAAEAVLQDFRLSILIVIILMLVVIMRINRANGVDDNFEAFFQENKLES
jgi:hypothetical protein